MGYVKHAFVLSMYCLIRSTDKSVDTFYEWIMYQILKLQGDTDTNCAIVGGVVGAYVGVHRIGQNQLRTLLECRQDWARSESNAGGAEIQFIMPGFGCIDEMLELVRIAPSEL